MSRGTQSAVAENVAHFVVDESSGTHSFLLPDGVGVSREIRHDPSGLFNNQTRRTGVPEMETELPESVKAIAGI